MPSSFVILRTTREESEYICRQVVTVKNQCKVWALVDTVEFPVDSSTQNEGMVMWDTSSLSASSHDCTPGLGGAAVQLCVQPPDNQWPISSLRLFNLIRHPDHD
ncbi:unnamed protein product [Rodentolepis nana]|uniref:START domain-containing protein n=1 Tax=Rodentolepis nana TaxID=102285 RepID=A0A0R3THM3_RODNA|nr:unnamed protein product [Rodentolepis nana]